APIPYSRPSNARSTPRTTFRKSGPQVDNCTGKDLMNLSLVSLYATSPVPTLLTSYARKYTNDQSVYAACIISILATARYQRKLGGSSQPSASRCGESERRGDCTL